MAPLFLLNMILSAGDLFIINASFSYLISETAAFFRSQENSSHITSYPHTLYNYIMLFVVL